MSAPADSRRQARQKQSGAGSDDLPGRRAQGGVDVLGLAPAARNAQGQQARVARGDLLQVGLDGE